MADALRAGRRTVRLASTLTCVALLASCSSDGRGLAEPDQPLTTQPLATRAAEATVSDDVNFTVPEPPVTTMARSPIVIDRLSSPENATAELSGVGALATDAVTVDGVEVPTLSFDVDIDGTFVIRVWIEDEGAHTVCVADACGRVYTLAPDAETPEEVIAMIEEAIPLAQKLVDYPTLFPEWTVEIGGLLSGTGGTTDEEHRVVTIYRNRGRSVPEFVRTIIHELGHVADFEWLDDDQRAVYRELRGIPAATPWRDEEATRLDDWGRQPSEDFAEVLAMIWSEGQYVPRTEQLAPTPDTATLAAVAELVGIDG